MENRDEENESTAYIVSRIVYSVIQFLAVQPVILIAYAQVGFWSLVEVISRREIQGTWRWKHKTVFLYFLFAFSMIVFGVIGAETGNNAVKQICYFTVVIFTAMILVNGRRASQPFYLFAAAILPGQMIGFLMFPNPVFPWLNSPLMLAPIFGFALSLSIIQNAYRELKNKDLKPSFMVIFFISSYLFSQAIIMIFIGLLTGKQ